MKFYQPLIYISFLIFCISSAHLSAQQDSQYTQYMYNPTSFNPGYAGSRETLSFLGVYRNQWVGLEGSPETLNFSVHSPLGDSPIGLGLGFISDKIGPSSESGITADFAYTIQISNTVKLGMGIKGGFSFLNINPDKLLIYDPMDYDLQRNNYSSPIIGAGLFLSNDKWYLGLSTPNFLETKHFKDIKVSTATEKTHLYLTGGYVFDLRSDFKLKPAFMVKSVTGAPLAVDVSLNILFMDQFTLGAAYRWDAALSGLAAFQVNEQILVGYSYDYETTELSRYSSGTHEILLRFEIFNNSRARVNPRFF